MNPKNFPYGVGLTTALILAVVGTHLNGQSTLPRGTDQTYAVSATQWLLAGGEDGEYRTPDLWNLICHNGDYLELTKEQWERLELTVSARNREVFAASISRTFPELADPYDPDIMERIPSLKLPEGESQKRWMLEQMYQVNMKEQNDRNWIKAITPILNQKQKGLLKDVMLNSYINNVGIRKILTGAAKREGLELSEKEKEKFRDEFVKVERELQADIHRLHREAWEKLMAKIPADELAKIEKSMLLDELDK